MENYLKIFHHLNFTVKIKKPGSADWTSAMYFAEVKSICMIKLYACYPLEQDQYGMENFHLLTCNGPEKILTL